MAVSSPWEITVQRKWCKKCRLCVEFCPKKVLEMGKDGPLAKEPEACIGCLMCEMHCPDFAITVVRRGDK